jgi:hypothetical protein
MHGRTNHPGLARHLLGAAAATVIALAAAAPALATTGFREDFAGDYAFSHDDCGWTVDVEGEFAGQFWVRVGKGDEATAFFGHQKLAWSETHVRRDTGATIVISSQTVFQETKGTRIEGNVFRFDSVEAGQQLTIRDGSGKILLLDRGSVHDSILLDTLGDATPGGTFIEEVDFRLAGRYPSAVTDYCSLFNG